MTSYNEERALANHTASHNKISKLVEALERRDHRISAQQKIIDDKQAYIDRLQFEASARGQAEKVFK